jgi:hypothetical protein
MSSQVLLDLPDDLLKAAESIARRWGRPVADVLRAALQSSLRPLGSSPVPDQPMSELSDAEVLAATEVMMPPAQDRRLSELLGRQREGELEADDKAELAALMQVYQEGLLTKAFALREAVHRGLRRPLEP